MTTTLLRLSGDHRAAYDRDGFVIINDVFDRDELTALDGELDRLERPGDHHDGVGFHLLSVSARP